MKQSLSLELSNDNKFLISHYDGKSIHVDILDSVNDAFVFIQTIASRKSLIQQKNYEGKQDFLLSVMNSALSFIDEVTLTPEELDRLEEIQLSLESFISGVESTYKCADNLEVISYDSPSDPE